MKKLLLGILTVITLLPAGHSNVLADNPTGQEIQHLLDFIAGSSCTFIRNGTEYPASDARAHIERKYGYVKSRVNSAEDFIKFTATQSSFSGKPYRVVCAGKESLSRNWLLDELEQFRQQQASARLAPSNKTLSGASPDAVRALR